MGGTEGDTVMAVTVTGIITVTGAVITADMDMDTDTDTVATTKRWQAGAASMSC
jgi:hypothetical protein